MPVPHASALLNPALVAFHELGGSASNEEHLKKVIELTQLPAEVLEESHLGSVTQTELGYRLAWARTHLKNAGLIVNSARGVWALTASGKETREVDPRVMRRTSGDAQGTELDSVRDEVDDEAGWKDQLLEVLRQMEPAAFERLCQRLLRESGFTSVTVTGRSSDGGIDGHGMIKLAGFLSFPVIFQSKRYQGSVGPSVVRDFRGAMIGRADRGLIITTGRFTREAEREAMRDGAPPVDLVDGGALAEKLKELELGVAVAERRVVERVVVDPTWFADL